jgi:ubiquitin carboxyl-terminal hydrolase 8
LEIPGHATGKLPARVPVHLDCALPLIHSFRAANSEAGHSTSGEGHARRNSGSGNIAQRLKSLQEAGLAGDLRAVKRPPQLSTLPLRPPTPVRPGTPVRPQTPSARPQTPVIGRPQTPIRSQTPTWPSSPGIPVSTSPRVQRSNPMLSSSLGKPSSPLAADGPWPVMRPTPASPPVSSSPHQLVPVSAFGPPSPSGSEKSLSDNAPLSTIPPSKRHQNQVSIHVPSPSEFASAYPTIEELEQMDPDEVLFPSVPRHDPGQKPILNTNGRETPTAKKQPNGVAIKPLHSSLYHHEQRPASTPPIPINSARVNGFSHSPPSPRHTRYPSGSPLNPAYNSPKTNSNISSGSLDGPSGVDIPITNSITPRRLFELLESRLNILLLDVRTREQFDQERINHDAIVCSEPSVLRREK